MKGKVIMFLCLFLVLYPLPGFCWTKVIEGDHYLLLRVYNPKGAVSFPDVTSFSFCQKTIRISEKEILVSVSVSLEGMPVRDPYPLPSSSLTSDVEPYMAPVDRIQSDDPEISKLARDLVHGSSFLDEAVVRILSWVADNISYDEGQWKADAREVFINRKGMCHGISLLCVALLRAAGIPSRPAAAFIPEGAPWDSPRIGMGIRTHVFVEVLYPSLGWVMYDPQESYHFVNPYHVYMYPLDGTRNRDLYDMISDPKTKVEILMDLDRTVPIDLLPYPKKDMMAQRVSAERFAGALVLDIRDGSGNPVGEGRAVLWKDKEGQPIQVSESGLGSAVGLPPGSYEVTVGGEGYADKDISVMVGEKELVRVRVALDKGAKVTVRLEDMYGSGIKAPGSVYIVKGRRRIGYPTGMDGTSVLYLPLGKHRIMASATGFLEREMDIEIKDLSDRELRMRLERAGSLEIHALSYKGLPIPGAEVLVMTGDIGLAYRAEEDGVLKLDLRPGRYGIKVSAPGYASYEGETTIEEGKLRKLDVVLKPAVSGLKVWVVDSVTSAPIPGAKVVLWKDGMGEAKPVSKEGYLEIPLPPGRYRVSGRADGYVEDEIEVSVPGPGFEEVRIGLLKGVLVKGKVYGADGKPLSSGFIYIWIGGRGKGYRISPDGSYSFSLLPGTYKITVKGGDSSEWEGEIEVKEGVTVRDIRIH